MQRILFFLFFGLAFAACADNTTDPGDTNTGGRQTVTMTAVTDLPSVGGNVTGIAIRSNNEIVAAIDGKIYSMSASGGSLQIINADPVHTAIALAPSGELYTVADTEIRVYNLASGAFTSAPIDPSGPFATNGRIEESEFIFSPSGEPYVRFISNHPRTYIYRTSDNGRTWENMALPPGFAYGGDLSFAPNGDILMSSAFSLNRSSDRGATWSTLPPARSGYGGTLLVAANGDIYHYPAGGGGLRVSRNGGTSFEDLSEFNKPLFFLDIQQGSDGALYSLANRKGGGYNAANGPVSLLRSTDGGTTWKHLLFAQGNAFAMRGSTIAVGLVSHLSGDGGGILLSTNSGAAWTSHGLRTVGNVNDAGFDRSGNLVVLADGGLYRRTSSGWQTLGAQNGIFHRFATNSQGDMIVATSTQVFYSGDDGATWTNNLILDYTPGGNGSVGVASLFGTRDGDFLFTINTTSNESGPVNGHLYRVGSDGIPKRIRGVTHTFSSLLEDHNGVLYGITQTLDPMSYTYYSNSYLSNDGGTTWTEVANAAVMALAFNAQNRFFAVSGQNTYTLRTPNGGAVHELSLDGFTSQGNYITRAYFGPDDRLYLITRDKGLFVSSAPLR